MKVTMPSASDVLQFRYFTSTPLWLIPPLLLFFHWDAPVNLKFGRFSPCLQFFKVNVATLMLSTVLLNRTLKLACDRVGYICFLKSICCNNMVHTTLQHFASYSSFFGWAGGHTYTYIYIYIYTYRLYSHPSRPNPLSSFTSSWIHTTFV